jgi:hypothetical protein
MLPYWHACCLMSGVRNERLEIDPEMEDVMKKFHMSVLAVSSIFAVSVQAAPTFSTGNNAVGFYAYENQYRSADACLAGGCLAATGDDPAGFQRVNPAIAGNIAQGDVFAGIVRIREITMGNGNLWEPSANDQFTGYFAQQVAGITMDPMNDGHLSLAQLTFSAPTVDPFGKLGAGEMMRLYTDSATAFHTGGTTATTIADATDGSLWAALSALGGYAYTLDDIAIAGSEQQFVAKNYAAYNISTYGASYNAGLLQLVNDASESFVGGVNAGPDIVCTDADILAGVVCTHFAGQSDIRKNSGTSPWYYIANDPLWMTQIPEPGTVALLGLSLFGLGVIRRRSN